MLSYQSEPIDNLQCTHGVGDQRTFWIHDFVGQQLHTDMMDTNTVQTLLEAHLFRGHQHVVFQNMLDAIGHGGSEQKRGDVLLIMSGFIHFPKIF